MDTSLEDPRQGQQLTCVVFNDDVTYMLIWNLPGAGRRSWDLPSPGKGVDAASTCSLLQFVLFSSWALSLPLHKLYLGPRAPLSFWDILPTRLEESKLPQFHDTLPDLDSQNRSPSPSPPTYSLSSLRCALQCRHVSGFPTLLLVLFWVWSCSWPQAGRTVYSLSNPQPLPAFFPRTEYCSQLEGSSSSKTDLRRPIPASPGFWVGLWPRIPCCWPRLSD